MYNCVEYKCYNIGKLLYVQDELLGVIVLTEVADMIHLYLVVGSQGFVRYTTCPWEKCEIRNE